MSVYKKISATASLAKRMFEKRTLSAKVLWAETTKKQWHFSVDLTHRCNLRCKHCYHFVDNKLPEDADTKTFEEFLLIRKEEGYFSIWLVGGEPALELEKIDLAYKLFPVVQIVSNGTIRIPEKYRVRIFVSFEGNKETNAEIRGPKVYEMIKDNYEGDKRVILVCTLNTLNFKCADEFCDIAKELDVAGVTFSLHTALSGRDDPLYLDPLSSRYKECKRQLVKVINQYPDFVMMTEHLLKTYEDKSFVQNCLQKYYFKAYDSSLRLKRPCTILDADCNRCGCINGLMTKGTRHIETMRRFMVYPITHEVPNF